MPEFMKKWITDLTDTEAWELWHWVAKTYTFDNAIFHEIKETHPNLKV